jgi:hypothetical protein
MTDKIRKSSRRRGDGYEKRDVNALKVAAFGITATLVLILVIVLLMNYFTLLREKVVYDEVLRPESVPLRELRVRETEELNSYAVIDAAKGVYRIPIERAMELMANENFQATPRQKQEGR